MAFRQLWQTSPLFIYQFRYSCIERGVYVCKYGAPRGSAESQWQILWIKHSVQTFTGHYPGPKTACINYKIGVCHSILSVSFPSAQLNNYPWRTESLKTEAKGKHNSVKHHDLWLVAIRALLVPHRPLIQQFCKDMSTLFSLTPFISHQIPTSKKTVS